MSDIQGFTERLKGIIADGFGGKPGRLARIAGIDAGNMKKYLAGSSLPGGETLFKIKEVSGVSIDWLLTGRDTTPETIAPEVKEVADLVLERGKLAEWLNYGRYLAGEKTEGKAQKNAGA